uniref:Uncharacterized protein n=1 Tax=Chenopodium quinoa TaxID=63459 RepID=A0A803NAS9_CHEQI
MDLESELTVVVGADANQRNGNHLLDSDQPTGSADPVEADTNHHSTGIEIQESRSLTNKGYGLKKWRRIRRKDLLLLLTLSMSVRIPVTARTAIAIAIGVAASHQRLLVIPSSLFELPQAQLKLIIHI